MTSNRGNLNGNNPISELNYKHLEYKKLCSVYDDNIFPFLCEFDVFSIENFKIISNFGLLQRLSRMTKHVSKLVKLTRVIG